MKSRTVFSIMLKDVRQGLRSSMFIFVLVAPFVYTFFIGMIFGGFFEEQPSLGVVDLGDSDLVPMIQGSEGWDVRIYATEKALWGAVERDVVGAGLVLIDGFDETLAQGDSPEMTLRFSGKSYASHRLTVQNTLSKLVREMAGQEIPVSFNVTVIGEERALSTEDRITPFIILIVIMISGYFLTSLGIVEEREEKTLAAVSVTPTTLTEFLTAKATLGYLMAIVMTLVTFALNGLTQPEFLSLLMPFILLGGIFAVSLGIMFGAYVKNSTELMATAKGINFLLMAPALVIMFPSIPQWIGKFFPSYYIINPVLEIAMLGAEWSDVTGDLMILIIVVAITAIAALVVANKRKDEL